MNILSENECNLEELESISKKLALESKVGNIYLLEGNLGTGKTTFARFFINALYDKEKIISTFTWD